MIQELVSKRSLFRISLISIVALLLVPTVALAAYGGSNPHANTHHSYPLGTVCGDALAGPWSATSYTGVATFRGWGVSFSLNNFALSGGASGTVSATSGSVSAVGHGHKLVGASFGLMSGTYQIVGGSMKIQFTVSGVTLTAPKTMSLGSPSLPAISVSCNTLDA